MAQKWFVNASHPGYGGAGPCPYVGGEFLQSGAGPSIGCGGIPGDPEKPNLSSESEDRPLRRPPFVSPSFPSSRASFSTADGESQLPHHVANYHCHGAALPIWASHLEPGSLSEGPQPFQRAGQVARADVSAELWVMRGRQSGNCGCGVDVRVVALFHFQLLKQEHVMSWGTSSEWGWG